MAINVTTNYCGKDSMQIIGEALLGGDTLDKQCLTILPEVKLSTTLHKVTTDDIVQADSCDFTASGDVNLDDKKITPEAYKVNVQICKTKLEQHWLSAQMRAGANNSDLPDNFADFILDYFAKKVAQKVDNLLWMASTAAPFLDEIDGFFKQMFDDVTVVDVPFVAITPANVIAQLQAMYDAIPATIINEPDFKFGVALNVAKAYKQAVAAASAEKYFVGDVQLDFLGIPLVPIRGMSASHMAGFQTSNMFMATDLMSDFNEARLLDMGALDGSSNVRVIMRFRVGVGFAFGSQVLAYQNTFV